jgi:DNA-binding CsgD family transcriptional regulator
MDSWRIGPDGPGGTANLLSASIGAIGSRALAAILFDELNRLSDFACLVASTIGPSGIPQADWTASGATPDFAQTCTQRYEPQFAGGDPVFEARQNLLHADDSNAILVNRISVKDISDAKHRRRIYDEFGLAERWTMARRIAPGVAVSMSLFKRSGQQRLSPLDAQALVNLSPLLLALVRRHRELLPPAHAVDATLRDRLRVRCPRLAPRELELCVRLLRGRTLDAVAAEWAVRPSTVETYRARAYRKLGIHFRSQLFAIAGGTAA